MAETPNRMAAYNQARAAAEPQKGVNYSELFVDNIFGLDNDYLSVGEKLKQAVKSDPIGFLKSAGISAYEGAKQAVTQPITTAEALLSGLYDSGVDVASTLGPDPTYLNDALQEMYGVTYDEATDEQVTAAREALFGDVFNVAGIGGPAALAAKTLVRGVEMPDPRVRPRGTGGAVIRRDDQFRGEGDMPISYISEGKTPADFSGQFAIRTTKQDQIDDIIQSGLVRQKKGGYGPKQKSTLYFGVQDSPETKVGISPGNLSGTSPYALVAKADEAAKYDNQGGIPLDALQHIWTLRDGKMTDILDEVKAKNREFEAEPSKSFNNGGEVDSTQGSTSILDLDPEAFLGALDELGLTGEERRFQTDQYFAKNRLFPMTSRPEGMKVRTILPIATPPGVTGAEALMSGNFDFTTPEFLRAFYEAPAEALNVLTAIGRGIPLTKSQIQDAAMVIPEMMTGLGPAKSVVRGVGAPDPSVVSMSGVGPRGMGDNAGPPLDNLETPTSVPAPRQRYVDPTIGRYSKAFEASMDLKQEVGTPQQMRAALINMGVPEDELLYTGFDNWLKGKDKVTKEEIVNILGDIAINKSGQGSLPFGRITHSATGITGGRMDNSLDDLRYQVQQDRTYDVQNEVENYTNTLRSDLMAQGFQPISSISSLDSPQELLKIGDLISDATFNGKYVDPSFKVRFERAQEYLNRGYDFQSYEVQQNIKGMKSSDIGAYVAPDGSILSEFMALEDQFPDREMPYDMDERLRDEILTSVEMMDEQEIADYLGVDVNDILTTLDPGDTSYVGYGPKGVLDYKENRYGYNDLGRGVLSGSKKELETQDFREGHFSRGSEDENRMYHTRVGFLNTPEGKAYHMFEAQSDIGQKFRENPAKFHITGTKPILEVPKAEKKNLQQYITVGKKYQDLRDQADAAMKTLYSDRYLDVSTGRIKKEEAGYDELASRIRDLRLKMKPLISDLTNIATNTPTLDEMRMFYGRPDMSILYGDELDIKAVEDALAGTLKPVSRAPGSPSGKTATRPFTTSTNRWVPSALKDELFNAANSDAEWFTLPLGKDVESWTYGESAGQEDFYENIVPTQLRKLLKKEFDLNVPIQRIKADGFLTRDNPTYEVNAIRLTPELKKLIKEQGFSSFKDGGPVQGSSLADVDVFALP